MAMNSKHIDLEKKAKQLLDDSVASIDAATQSKLNQARQVALSHGKKSRVSYLPWFSGLVTASAVVLLLIVVMPLSPSLPPSSFSMNQLEQLVMVEELDLYNDLEFYQWLDDGNG